MTHHEQALVEALLAVRCDACDEPAGEPCDVYSGESGFVFCSARIRALAALPTPNPLPELRPAREVAHEFLNWAANILACRNTGDNHTEACERLTGAIEADRLSRPEVLGRDGSLATGLEATTLEMCAQACEAERRDVTVTISTGAFERGFVEGCLSCRDRIRHLGDPLDAGTRYEQTNQAGEPGKERP
jgi:hypothetical protein